MALMANIMHSNSHKIVTICEICRKPGKVIKLNQELYQMLWDGFRADLRLDFLSKARVFGLSKSVLAAEVSGSYVVGLVML